MLAVLVLLAYWYALKSTFLANLEYSGDLFTALQMSRSFAEGRPLLSQNADNQLGAGHNYYVLPLFFPLTSWMGARGLFVGTLVLWCAALYKLVGRMRGADPRERAVALSVAIGFFLGPVAFWLFDEVPHGWHAELLFLPLSTLFGLDLLDRRRRAWLWALLLVLTREEGPVVAWAVHALCVWHGPPAGGSDRRARWRRIASASVAWALVFVAGLGLLWLRGANAADGRIGVALRRAVDLLAHPELYKPLGWSFLGVALLFFTLAPLRLAGLPLRRLLLGLAVSIPLGLAQVAASLMYSGPNIALYGPTWPPRMVLPWSVVAVAAFAAVRRVEEPTRAGPRAGLVAAAIALCLLGQAGALGWTRSYDVLARLSPRNLWDGRHLFAGRFTERELALLRCAGRAFPPSTRILASNYLFAPLERQDLLNPFRPHSDYGPRPPHLIVCDLLQRGLRDGCRSNQAAGPAGEFQQHPVEGLLVSRRPDVPADLRGCLPVP